MKYFTTVDHGKFPNLFYELEQLLESGKLCWTNNQICLNTIPNHLDDFKLGTGSLDRDWNNMKTVEGVTGQNLMVDSISKKFEESDFTTLCSVFVGTEFQKVYEMLNNNYSLGRVRLMKIDPKKCMSWHFDYSKRIHYVLQTSPGAHLVVEDEVKFLEKDTWCIVDTTKYHTAFNGSLTSRIHLVASLL